MRRLWNHACPPILMQIPDTPEDLFELLSEQVMDDLFENHRELKPFLHKILHLFNTELTKGTLDDITFRDSLGLVVSVWLELNRRSTLHLQRRYNAAKGAVTRDWMDNYIHAGRLNAYLQTLLSVIGTLPALSDAKNPDDPIFGHYSLPSPNDA